MLRKTIVLAALLVALCASSSYAAITTVTTLVKEPPGIAFASPEAALAAPWVSYTLDLNATAGELIGAVDVKITGQLHQRWSDADEDGVFDPTANANSAASLTQGDSHLSAIAGALFGRGPTEDNSGTGSPLANTSTRMYGVGTNLDGAWGIQTALGTASLAYIVIPAGTGPTLDIAVKVANPLGDIIAELTEADFDFGDGGGDTAPPVITALNQAVTLPSVITDLQLSAADETGPVVWSALTYAGGPGKNHAGSADATLGATGLFNWNPAGWKQGIHTFNAIATDSANPANSTASSLVLTVNLTVPEPATLSMLGLALVGCVGVIRRRG